MLLIHTSTQRKTFPAIGLAQLLEKHKGKCHHNHLWGSRTWWCHATSLLTYFPLSNFYIYTPILTVCTQIRNLSARDFTLLSLQNCVKKTANQFHSQCSRSRRQFILTSDTCWLLLPIMPDAIERGCRNNSVDGAIKLVKILEVCCAWFSASLNSHHKQNSDTYSFFVNFLTGKETHINSM